ncbi:MAG: LysR family transcriptional regulator [Lachnospiraceae bacterium]
MRSDPANLLTFLYIAREGSVSAAAKALSVSQPAVSQQLKNLEEHFGIPLFVRTARGMKLTREGETLYTYVSRGMDLLDAGEKAVQRMQNLDLGEVHLGASDMTLHFFLLPYLETFHEKYPGIKVSVSNAPTPETLENLRAGTIDFGVVSGPLKEEENAGIEVFPVRTIRDIFVAGEKFARLRNRQITLRELAELPLIFLEKNTSTRRYLDRELARYGVSVSPEFALSTSDMIVQFAKRNLGIGAVVEDFARKDMERGTLFPILLSEKIPERQFYVAARQGEPLPTAAKHLFDRIREDSRGQRERMTDHD